MIHIALFPKNPLTRLGEIFLHEVHIRHLEGLAVEIIQRASLGGKGEAKLIGIQGLVGPVEALVELSVLAIAQQRVSGVGKLGTDLVGPAGDELALHQTEAVPRIQDLVVGLTALGTGLGLVADEDTVFLGILEQIPLEAPLFALGHALDDGKIPLVQLPVLDLLVHDPQGLGGLGGDDDAAGVPVDAVAERRGEGVLPSRAPLPLLVEVGLDVVDEGAAVLRAVVGMDGKTGPLVHKQDVFILIDDGELRGCDGQVGVVLPGLVEELVIDIQLKDIALFQPGVPVGAGVVELDALDADILLGQRRRQQGHGLG